MLSRISKTAANKHVPPLLSDLVKGKTKPYFQDAVTPKLFWEKYSRGDPITMVTPKDMATMNMFINDVGIDICVTGNVRRRFVANPKLSAFPLTIEETVDECRMSRHDVDSALLVGEFPVGINEGTTRRAVHWANRMLKEGRVDAVKVVGGSPSKIALAKTIVDSGIPVIGHVIDLTPPHQTPTTDPPEFNIISSAVKVVETAMAFQEAGCFAIVLEHVPAPVAAAATSALHIPTIGIQAGPFCSGQALAFSDIKDKVQHMFPNNEMMISPGITDAINKVVLEYKEEMVKGSFPALVPNDCKMNHAVLDGFFNELRKLHLDKAAIAAAEAAKKINNLEKPGVEEPLK